MHPERRLNQLLLGCLGPGQLRWLAERYFPELAANLPGDSASHADLASAAAGIVRRHGLEHSLGDQRGFFDVLAGACPDRQRDILEVAGDWGVEVPENPVRVRLPASFRCRVFLSYSRRDEQWALLLEGLLTALGLQPFLDTASIRAGEDWAARLRSEIASSDRFLLIWSRNAASSDWVGREVERALQVASSERVEGFVLVLRLDDTPVPPGLSHIQHIDLAGLLGGSGGITLTPEELRLLEQLAARASGRGS